MKNEVILLRRSANQVVALLYHRSDHIRSDTSNALAPSKSVTLLVLAMLSLYSPQIGAEGGVLFLYYICKNDW